MVNILIDLLPLNMSGKLQFEWPHVDVFDWMIMLFGDVTISVEGRKLISFT
jgi:hypothetical protein